MALLKYLIFALLYLLQLHRSNAEIEVLKKTIELPKDLVLLYEPETYTSPLLTYSLCNVKHWVNHQVTCKVIREKSPYSNETNSCDVVLKFNDNTIIEWWKNPAGLNTIPLGNDSVILYISESNRRQPRLKILTVKLDGCKVNEYEMLDNNYFFENKLKPNRVWDDTFKFVTYDDSYELYYVVNKSGLVLQRLTFDLEGKIIEGPVDTSHRIQDLNVYSYKFLHSITPISTSSRQEGLFIYIPRNLLRVDSPDRFKILQSNGQEKDVDVIEPIPYQPAGWSRRAELSIISTANGRIGICLTYHNVLKYFKCRQYVKDSSTKLVSDSFTFGFETYNFATYNLPDGGFLVAGTSNMRFEGSIYHKVDFQWFILKIDSNGKAVGKIDLQGLPAKDIRFVNTLFYVNDEGKYCFSCSNQEFWPRKSLDLVAHCFTDADFLPYSYRENSTLINYNSRLSAMEDH